MSAEQKPHASIEGLFGFRNRAAVHEAASGNFTVIPENVNRSQNAQELSLLHPFDPSMRYTDSGKLWISTLRDDGSSEERQKPILLERWSEYDSLPDARRGLHEHVVLPYGKKGEERRLREQAAKLITHNIRLLKSPETTIEDLEAMNQKTLDELGKLRYGTSTIPERQEVVELMDRSTKPDRRGRLNKPAGRMMENAARSRVAGDLTLDDKKHNKNARRVIRLDAIGDYIEAVMLHVAERSLGMRELSVGTGAFESELGKYLTEVNLLLSPTRGVVVVQPYLTAAVIARHDLFARGEADDIIKVAVRAGLETAIKICDDAFVPFGQLQGDPYQQQRRIVTLGENLSRAVSKANLARFSKAA